MNFASFLLFICLLQIVPLNGIGEKKGKAEKVEKAKTPPHKSGGGKWEHKNGEETFEHLLGMENEQNAMKIIDELEQRELADKAEYGRRVAEIDYKIQDEFLDTKMHIFDKWLVDQKNAQIFLKIFIYLNNLDNQPICLAMEMLHLIDTKKLLQAELTKMLKKPGKEGQKKGEEEEEGKGGGKMEAYHFGQQGVEIVGILGEGIKCRASLEEPWAVRDLLVEISRALREYGGEGEVNGGTKDKEKIARRTRVRTASVATMAGLLKSANPNKGEKTLREFLEEEKESDKMEKLQAVAFSEKIKFVFEHLESNYKGEGNFKILIDKKIAKWETWKHRMETVEKGLMNLAIWLFSPTNFNYLLMGILTITKLSSPVAIDLDIFRSFGIDSFLIKETNEVGILMTKHCFENPQESMWLFSPNGVIPLYLRGYQAGEEESTDYWTHLNGECKKYTQREVQEWQQAKEGQKEFVKKIAESIIHRQGYPMDQLMEHAVDNLRNAGKEIEDGFHAKLEAANGFWHEIKIKGIGQVLKEDLEEAQNDLEEGMKGIAEDLKVFTGEFALELRKYSVWLFTPKHLFNMLKLLLTILAPQAYTAVYVTVEVLQYTGLTDLIIEMLDVTDENLKKTKLMMEHPSAGKFLDFVMKDNGLVPMFLEFGNEKALDNFRKEREIRVGRELEMLHVIREVVVEHDGKSLKELHAFFVERVRGNETMMSVISVLKSANNAAHDLAVKMGLTSAHKATGNENWGKLRKNMGINGKVQWIRALAQVQKKRAENGKFKKNTKQFDAKIVHNESKMIGNVAKVANQIAVKN